MRISEISLIISAFAIICTGCTDELASNEILSQDVSSETIGYVVSTKSSSRYSQNESLATFRLHSVDGDSLYANVEVSDIDNEKSRGYVITSINNFTVSCIVTNSENQVCYFERENYNNSTDPNKWENTAGNEYYWLGSNLRYDFYAYSNINGAEFNTKIAGTQQTDYSTFDYSVPNNPGAQNDILGYYASTENGGVDYGYTVNLQMNHLLSQISFKQGDNIAMGKINSITISGLYGSGKYSFENGWTTTGSTTNYLLNWGGEGFSTPDSNPDMTSDGLDLFLIPQSLENIPIEISFTGNNGKTSKYSSTLTGTWEQGKKYTYTITVNPDMSIEIADADLMQDAHYVIMQGGKVKVNIANLPTSKTATLRATVAEGDASEPVTVQLEENLNSFAQDGFWTDYYLVNNSNTIDYNSSARGNRNGSLTGLSNGEYNIAVFIPENKGEINKQIKLSLYVGDSTTPVATKTITQYYPEWVGTYGWERMSDSETVQYGFDWNRISIYVFPYNCNSSGVGVHYTIAQARALIQGIIDNFDAGAYASYHSYSVGILGTQTRYYIKIDYSKLNNLEGQADNTSDGLANTKALNTFGGAASTSAFEDYVTNTYKTESGHETERMFRDRADSDPSSVPYPSGTNDMESGLLNYTLKLNKYYVKRTSTDIGSSTAPYIFQDDIVWYAPAYGQFSSLPTITNPITAPAIYWSSTASTGTNSFLGSGTEALRTSYHSLRCCRTKP